MNNQITAEVLEDSIYNGSRLVTLRTVAPKFLDAEVCKSRMISSNSSSDRAIPFETMLKREPFIMEDIRVKEKGMQGYTQIDAQTKYEFQRSTKALYASICATMAQYKDEIHKQHLNRYLLPFTLQTKVLTANVEQFYYFIALRESPGADPAIQVLATKIREALQNSTPKNLEPGQWHLPLVLEEEQEHPDACKLSVARCARTSYNRFDGSNPNVEDDFRLYDQLAEMKHYSCFEHQATPMKDDLWPEVSSSKMDFLYGVTHQDVTGRRWSGNFCNWVQYRQLVSKWN